jgi:hypothetical protein
MSKINLPSSLLTIGQLNTETARAEAVEAQRLPAGLVLTPEQFGAVGDLILFEDGQIQSGSSSFTSQQITLAVAASINSAAANGKPKHIYIAGAGGGTQYGTLSAALSTSSAISSITANVTTAIPAGPVVITSGANAQVFVLAAATTGSAKTLTTGNSYTITPSYAFPSGSTISSLGPGLTTTITAATSGAGTSLTSGLTSGTSYSSLPVAPLSQAISGATVTLTDPSAVYSQNFVTTGASVGATSLPIITFGDVTTIPTYSYPAGSTVNVSSWTGTVTLATAASSTIQAAIGWFGTDDTTAWQNMIDSIPTPYNLDFMTTTGATIVPGKPGYLFAATPRTDRSGNAQLALPADEYARNWIRIMGPQDRDCIIASTSLGNGYSSSYGPPSIIGGGTTEQVGVLYAGGTFEMDHFTILAPANPTLGGIDLYKYAAAKFDSVTINAGGQYTCPGAPYGLGGMVPTSKNSFGIRFPTVDNDGNVHGDHVNINGFYLGMFVAEHTILRTYISNCVLGIAGNDLKNDGVTVGAGGHSNDFVYVDIEGCIYGISGWDATNGVRAMQAGSGFYFFGQIDFEDWMNQWTPLYHFGPDTNNCLTGRVYTHRQTFSGYSSAPLVDGGTKLLSNTVDPTGSATAPYIQAFTSTGTWTKPGGISVVHVSIIGGGGGGQAGGRQASGTASVGGNGGGGGGYSSVTLPASAISTSVTVTVGALGAAAATQTTDNTTGVSGGNGGYSSFGSYAYAAGGTGGTSASNGIGGLGETQQGGSSVIASPTGGQATNVSSSGMTASGGAGGGVSTAAVASTGAAGGAGQAGQTAGGTAGAVGTAGGTGGSTTTGIASGGGGGGGGGASVSGAAAAGGTAGNYGSGGGGGGASMNGYNSGAGAAGKAGIVIVTCY